MYTTPSSQPASPPDTLTHRFYSCLSNTHTHKFKHQYRRIQGSLSLHIWCSLVVSEKKTDKKLCTVEMDGKESVFDCKLETYRKMRSLYGRVRFAMPRMPLHHSQHNLRKTMSMLLQSIQPFQSLANYKFRFI